MPSKTYLRKLYLGKRLKLSPAKIEKKSKQVAKNLFSIDKIDFSVLKAGALSSSLSLGIRDKRNFSVYLPINNEVDTKFIINNLLGLNKHLYCPYFSNVDNVYYLTKFLGWQNLEKGPYQILQPSKSEKVNPAIIEVAIVPSIAFDLQGTRLGYGKGVFDRLLAKSKALRIGLAYDFQIVDEIPKEEHDLVMDTVVTEKQILRF